MISRLRLLRFVFRATMAVVLFGVTMEICARIDDRITYSAPLFENYNSKRIRSRDDQGIRHNVPGSRYEKWSINHMGFRGEETTREKPDGVYRIACMGTSETFGLYEDEHMEWPAQLQRILGKDGQYEIINTAVVGLSPDLYLPYLEKYVFPMKPDAVVILVNPYSKEYITKRRLDVNNQKLPSKEKKRISRPSLELRVPSKVKQIVKNLLPEVLLHPYQKWNMKRRVRQLEFQILKGKPPDDRISTELVEAFSAQISSIVTNLEMKGIHSVLATYPVLISHENLQRYKAIFWDNRRFSVHLTFQGMIDTPLRINEKLREIATEKGVGWVDAAGTLPQSDEYFADNVHYTNRGATLMADLFAEYFRGKLGQTVGTMQSQSTVP